MQACHNLRHFNKIHMLGLNTTRKLICSTKSSPYHDCSYTQGQTFNNTREYFYYVDHHGMLFLDDSKMKNFTSCFKEKKFLRFFFRQIKLNDKNRYIEFPYLSPCGPEINFIRCDDLPIVYTHLITKETADGSHPFLTYGYADDSLSVPFEAKHLSMDMKSGRVYFPAAARVGGVGLIRSKLAIELSSKFIFANGDQLSPTHIKWDGKEIELSNAVVAMLKKMERNVFSTI